MIFDLEQMKKCGLNMVRKHLKIEPRDGIIIADRLGLVVWQDPGQWRRKIQALVCDVCGNADVLVEDSDERYLSGASGKKRKGRPPGICERNEGDGTSVKRHPSIAAWTIFYEGWGQFQTEDMTAILRKEDPDRLIDQASGWFDQGEEILQPS